MRSRGQPSLLVAQALRIGLFLGSASRRLPGPSQALPLGEGLLRELLPGKFDAMPGLRMGRMACVLGINEGLIDHLLGTH